VREAVSVVSETCHHRRNKKRKKEEPLTRRGGVTPHCPVPLPVRWAREKGCRKHNEGRLSAVSVRGKETYAPKKKGRGMPGSPSHRGRRPSKEEPGMPTERTITKRTFCSLGTARTAIEAVPCSACSREKKSTTGETPEGPNYRPTQLDPKKRHGSTKVKKFSPSRRHWKGAIRNRKPQAKRVITATKWFGGTEKTMGSGGTKAL